MEEEKQNKRERYIDFTKLKEPEVKPKEETKLEVQQPIQSIKSISSPQIIKKPIAQEESQPKERKNLLKIIVVGGAILILFSLLVSGYLYYEFNLIKEQKIIYDADWNCIAEKCTEYWTQESFVKENCNLNEPGVIYCEIDYQGQQVTLPLEQINIQPDTMCKTSECAVEIPIRKKL